MDIFTGYEFSHIFPQYEVTPLPGLLKMVLLCSAKELCEILAHRDVTIKTVSFRMCCHAVCYISTDVLEEHEGSKFLCNINSRHHSLDNKHLKIIMLTAY
jgi:hypothetical protein